MIDSLGTKATVIPVAQTAEFLPLAQTSYSQFGEALNKRYWQDL